MVASCSAAGALDDLDCGPELACSGLGAIDAVFRWSIANTFINNFGGSCIRSSCGAPLVVRDLGRATVPVDGTWQFHTGDDRRWAATEFDDSGWQPIEVGRSWEEQGHPNMTGFGWYRRHIVLATGTNAGWKLALLLPTVQDAAEVYWNGQLVGSYGKVPPDAVWYGQFTPAFPPALLLGSAQSGVLAIRVWKAPYAYLSYSNQGGLTGTPLLGSEEAVHPLSTLVGDRWLRSNEYRFGVALLCSVVSLLALLAWLRDRRQWMLFWLSAYMVRPLALLLANLPWLSWRFSYGTIGTVFSATDAALWFLLLYLLGLRENRQLVRWTRVFACITVGLQLLEGSEQLFDWTRAPHFFLMADVGLTIPCLVVQTWGIVLVVFAFRKRLDAARWMVAIFALLVDVAESAGSWFNLGVRWTHWTLGIAIESPLFTLAGNEFRAETIGDTLLLVAVVYAVWRYETEQRQRQSLLDEEFRNAQELQQVLVPQSLPEIDGFTVTSAYLPAQVVGGDFFQIIPLGEGQALAVVGDVSGKGLRAAMTVSLIVGALRSLVRMTRAPGKILAGLNEMLQGRLHSGFATCVVLRLDADGACAVANAGHLSPFLNGQEMDLPGALPLGLSAETEYTETSVTLEVGDRLTLYTDGLVEARNEQGEMFGFARVAALFAARPDAAAAAEAAVRFGQDDDVTVLVVARDASARFAPDVGLAAAADGVTA
jgi:hypothetical protein